MDFISPDSFFIRYLLNGEQYPGGVDGAGHGDAGQEGTHHHQFRGEIFMVMEFHGVKYGIHRSRDAGHDEDGLFDDGVKGNSCHLGQLDQDEATDGSHHKANGASGPGIGVGEGKMGPVNLHAQGNHDDGHQGLGAALEDRPYEEGGHIDDTRKFNGKYGYQGINDGHVENNRNGVSRSKLSYSCLVEAQGIEAHIHLHQHDGGAGAGFCQVRELPINDIGSVGKDEGNEGDTDIPVIREHGSVFQGRRLSGVHPPEFSVQSGDGAYSKHLDEGEDEDIQHGHIQLCHINAVENKAGKHHVECKLREGGYIHFEFHIQQIPDGYEDQEGDNVIGNDLEKRV